MATCATRRNLFRRILHQPQPLLTSGRTCLHFGHQHLWCCHLAALVTGTPAALQSLRRCPYAAVCLQEALQDASLRALLTLTLHTDLTRCFVGQADKLAARQLTEELLEALDQAYKTVSECCFHTVGEVPQ